MYDAQTVQVLDTMQDLQAKVTNHRLRKLKPALLHELKEVPALDVLHDNVKELLSLKEVNQPNQIRVLAHFQDLKFPLVLGHLGLVHLGFVQDLDCNLQARDTVHCKIHCAVRPLAELGLHLVKVLDFTEAGSHRKNPNPLLLQLRRLKVKYP